MRLFLLLTYIVALNCYPGIFIVSSSTDRFKIRNNVIITEAQKIDDNGVNKAQAWDSRYMGVVNNNAYGGANLNNRRADDENARVAVKSDYVS